MKLYKREATAGFRRSNRPSLRNLTLAAGPAFAVSFLAVLVCALFRFRLSSLTGDLAAFLPFTPAVMVSAYVGGLRTGLFATLLGLISGNYLWQEPAFSFGISETAEAFSAGVFVLAGVTISTLSEFMHRARRDAAHHALNAQNAETRLRLTLDSVADYAICTLSSKGTVSTWNRGAEMVYGYSANEICGSPVARLYPQELPESLPAKEVDTTLDTGRYEFECLQLRSDGSTFWASLLVRPIHDPQNILRGFVRVVRDMTERKAAQEALEHSRAQLRDLLNRLDTARETERLAVAREIHDEVGQILTLVRLDLQRLDDKLPPHQRDEHEAIEGALSLLDGTIDDLRDLCSRLRPRVLDLVGLAPALQWQSEQFTAHSGIPCSFSSSGTRVDADEQAKTALFRIYQEALTNVARHSGATEVVATYKEIGDRLRLDVQDNGKGLVDGTGKEENHLGIAGIQERVLALDGLFELEGSAGTGTRLTVWLPLRPVEPHSQEDTEAD